MLYGRTTVNRLSRFIRDIPPELLDQSSRAGLRPRPAPPADSGRLLYDDLPFSKVPGAGSRDQGFRPQEFRTQGSGGQWNKSPRQPLAAEKNAGPVPDFRVGDAVLHNAFGRGMVLTVTKMGNDALLEIAFDEKGTKKLLAKTAAIHMKKL